MQGRRLRAFRVFSVKAFFFLTVLLYSAFENRNMGKKGKKTSKVKKEKEKIEKKDKIRL